MPGETIPDVDDEVDSLDLARLSLPPVALRVERAGDGEQALELIVTGHRLVGCRASSSGSTGSACGAPTTGD